MITKELRFWYRPYPTLVAYILLPFSILFLVGAWLRKIFTTTNRVPIPVICIGNINVGGSGKTPTALKVADILKQRGKKVHFLTRGYGGLLKGPLQVRPDLHTAEDVGDEALLLSDEAPTWVSVNRYLGARKAYEAGAEVIVMDDGFQNPSLYKDFSIIVVDAARQFGNGLVLPAGPLREPVFDGLSRANAIVLVGEGDFTALQPVFRGHIKPLPQSLALLQPIKYFAFSGIGNPGKFFKTLENANVDLVGRKDFPDHHRFTRAEMFLLAEQARQKGASLITTYKDWVRIPPAYREEIAFLDVELEFQDEGALWNLMQRYIQ